MSDSRLQTDLWTLDIESSSCPIPTNYTDKLPNEILIHIISFLPPRYPRRGGLYSCCLVSKRFHSVATSLLYRNLPIVYFSDVSPLSDYTGSGSFPSINFSLVRIRSRSLESVRNVEITNIGRGNMGKGGLIQRNLRAMMGKMIRQLFRRFVRDQIQSITVDSLQFVKYLPTPYVPKVRHLAYDLRREDGSRELGPDDTNLLPVIHDLKSLHLRDIQPSFSNMPFKLFWDSQRYEGLKSLCLTPMFSWFRDNLPDDNLALSLDRYEESREEEGFIEPRVLQSLEIKESLYLNDNVEAFNRLVVFEQLTFFKIVRCLWSEEFLKIQIPRMEHLTSLHMSLIDNDMDLGELLTSLKSSLRSLHLIIGTTHLSDSLTTSLQKHAKTLRKLWLDITPGNNISRNEPIYAWFLNRVLSDAPKLSFLDKLQPSKFPQLKHLAIGVPQPPFSKLEILEQFPSLKSFHVLNDIGFSSSKDDELRSYRRAFADWLLIPYNISLGVGKPENLHPCDLKVISFRGGTKLAPFVELTFGAFIQTAEEPGVFGSVEMDMIDVGLNHPDIRDFLESE